MDPNRRSKWLEAENALEGSRLTAKSLERRVLRDLLVCALVVISFSSVSYVFSLQDAVAQWTGRPELSEVDWLAMVLMYSVWLAGIFALRRLYDLRAVMRDRERIDADLSTTRTVGAVSRLAGGIAHDLNNLMSVVRASVDIASMNSEDAAIREILEPAKEAVDNATRLSAMLGRLDAQKPDPAQSLDVNDVISQMMGLLKHLAHKNEVSFKTELDECACTITASKGHIEQVVLNLVTNACEAMAGEHDVTVETRCVTLPDDAGVSDLDVLPGEYVEIVVRDTGPGIPVWVKEHMYEAYFTTKESGTGMGLATVYSLVSKNNGAIDVISSPDDGTRISVYWPRAA